MATWVFVRHGESVANAEGWLSGFRDVALTDTGVAQAQSAGQALADTVFDQVFSSDLQRARETARLILGDRPLTLHQSPSLRERNLGVFEGVQKSELRADGRMDLLVGWNTKPAGGESHRDLALRALPFLSTLDCDKRTLIVSHGGMIRTLLGLLDNKPTDQIGKTWVHNCQPTSRDMTAGDWERALERA
jgi:broad specificity phosphatase PhoE